MTPFLLLLYKLSAVLPSSGEEGRTAESLHRRRRNSEGNRKTEIVVQRKMRIELFDHSALFCYFGCYFCHKFIRHNRDWDNAHPGDRQWRLDFASDEQKIWKITFFSPEWRARNLILICTLKKVSCLLLVEVVSWFCCDVWTWSEENDIYYVGMKRWRGARDGDHAW